MRLRLLENIKLKYRRRIRNYMLNQSVLVGRLTSDVEVRETENGKQLSVLTLAVPRSYKNELGEYETDFIDCVLWNQIAANTAEYCRKGDMIAVKGRLQTSTYEIEDGTKRKVTEVIVEKITFLSSRKED